MINPNWKQVMTGGALTFGLLTAGLPVQEELDLIVFPFQGTLERPAYIFNIQDQPDDLPFSTATAETITGADQFFDFVF